MLVRLNCAPGLMTAPPAPLHGAPTARGLSTRRQMVQGDGSGPTLGRFPEYQRPLE